MPRLYKRKTNKGLIPVEVMKNAVDAVKAGRTVRRASIAFGIPRTTLTNNVKKSEVKENLNLQPNYKHSMACRL